MGILGPGPKRDESEYTRRAGNLWTIYEMDPKTCDLGIRMKRYEKDGETWDDWDYLADCPCLRYLPNEDGWPEEFFCAAFKEPLGRYDKVDYNRAFRCDACKKRERIGYELRVEFVRDRGDSPWDDAEGK